MPWVSGFDALLRTRESRFPRPAPLPDHPLFGPFERQEFEHTVRRTAETLIAMVGTHSHMLVASEEEREALNDKMRSYLSSMPQTAHGEFDLPLRTSTYRSTRSDD